MPNPALDPDPTPGPMPDSEKRFLGLDGLWRQWANFGIVGVIAGLMSYVVMFTIPDLQRSHLQTIERVSTEARSELQAERAAGRSDAEKSREHGNKSADKLAESLDGLREVMSDHKAMVKINQEAGLEAQKVMIQQNKTLIEKMK